MKRVVFLNIVLFFVCFYSFSQRKSDNIITFDNTVQTVINNERNGSVIVMEDGKISSYNPETNKIEWTVSDKDIVSKFNTAQAQRVLNDLQGSDLLKLFENNNSIAFIENSPFIKGAIKGKDVIINSFSGEVVYSSLDKDYKIVLSQYLLETNQFLFLATKGKNVICVLYDLVGSSEQWVTNLATTDSYLKSIKNMFLKRGITREDQIAASKNAIYTTFNNKLYKINKDNGALLWTPDYEVNRFFISRNGEYIIITKNLEGLLSSKQALNILRANDGESIWKSDIKTKYISYIEDWGEKILVAHSSGFNFYEYKTGNKIWKKEPKGSDIKRVITIDDNYLYVAENEMMLIDRNGQKLWKKFIEISDDKTDPVYFLDKIDNNKVFYLTGTYANMVDYTSGKKLWKKNVKLDKKRPILYAFDERTKSFLVYNDEKIYKFDPNSTDNKLDPFAKLKVKNDKAMSGIELFDWGVALTGQNDVIGVTLDGKTKYHNLYKEPGEVSRRLLKTAGSIGKSFTALKSSIQSGLADAKVSVNYRDDKGNTVTQEGFLVSDRTRESLNRKADMNQNISSAIDQTVLARVNKRYNALKQNSEFAFIFARGESKESNYIVKVRKSDGKEIDKIEIQNTKPIYEIDDITGNIYYAYEKELRIFSQQ